MANPFLVLGGVAVGVITAGIGVLAVPGWINSANDSAAINDLGSIRGAESAAILHLGEYTDDFGVLRSGELGVKFQKSDGVTLIGLKADTNESWCAAVQSKSGKFFAASNVQAAIATGPGAEAAMTTAKCDPALISVIIDEANNHVPPINVGTPGTGGGSWVGGGSEAGGGTTPTTPDPEPVFQTITWSINCPAGADVTVPLPGAFGTITWSDGETYPIQGSFPTRSVPAGTDLKVSFTGEVYSKMMVADGVLPSDVLACYRGLDSFGDGTGINSMRGAFKGMTNLTAVPSKIPSGMTTMMGMFEGATSFNDDVSGWDTSAVTEMRFVFKDATAFNKPLNGWDVGNVTDFEQAFYGASAFNQPLDSWDTSAAESMSAMFWGASSFDGAVNTWDVSNVWNMNRLFREAAAFNQPLDNWNVSNVSEASQMFFAASSFNQPVGGWNLSQARDVAHMFFDAKAFSQDISGWRTPNASTNSSDWGGSALTADKVPASWR